MRATPTPCARFTSSKVVRLDNATARWTVDLDTGADGRSTHMKGNILASVRFTTDAKGRPVNTSLLVAASQADHSQTPAGGNALSVFVRDDAAGTWSATTLLPGPTGGRKVPRAIRVYHDDVTKVDRIFMLAGQPGIISGVFDSVKNQIVWDDAVEYPPTGNFSTRPLGLAEANGRLYFSVGGQIFVRVNGAKPDWTLAWSIPGNVNIEVWWLLTHAAQMHRLALCPPSPHIARYNPPGALSMDCRLCACCKPTSRPIRVFRWVGSAASRPSRRPRGRQTL